MLRKSLLIGNKNDEFAEVNRISCFTFFAISTLFCHSPFFVIPPFLSFPLFLSFSLFCHSPFFVILTKVGIQFLYYLWIPVFMAKATHIVTPSTRGTFVAGMTLMPIDICLILLYSEIEFM